MADVKRIYILIKWLGLKGLITFDVNSHPTNCSIGFSQLIDGLKRDNCDTIRELVPTVDPLGADYNSLHIRGHGPAVGDIGRVSTGFEGD